jgi:hypothetical protein
MIIRTFGILVILAGCGQTPSEPQLECDRREIFGHDSLRQISLLVDLNDGNPAHKIHFGTSNSQIRAQRNSCSANTSIQGGRFSLFLSALRDTGTFSLTRTSGTHENPTGSSFEYEEVVFHQDGSSSRRTWYTLETSPGQCQITELNLEAGFIAGYINGTIKTASSGRPGTVAGTFRVPIQMPGNVH